MKNTNPYPPLSLPTQYRIATLDVLRGLALVGILIVNMEYYSQTAYDGWVQPEFRGWVDMTVRWLVINFFQLKAYLVFGLLFGYGIGMQLQRRALNAAIRANHLRRMLMLAILGVAHAVLLFSGDILLTYALCGMTSLALWRSSPTRLIAWSAFAFFIGFVNGILLVVLFLLLPEAMADSIDIVVVHDIYAHGTALEMISQRLIMRALLRTDGKILRPETLREMFTQQNQKTASRDIAAPKMGPGFCLELPGRLQGRAAVWHNGGIRSDYSLLIILPDDDLGFAIVASSYIDVDELAENILVKALELRTGQDIAELSDMPDRLTPAYQTEDLAGYYFATLLEGVWEITERKSRLYAKTNDGTSLNAVPTPRGDLELEYSLFGVIPLPVEKLKSVSFSIRRNSQW